MDLAKAIRKKDIDLLKHLLTSGECSINEEPLDGHPPVIECLIAKQEHENLTPNSNQGDNIEDDEVGNDDDSDDDSDNDSDSDGDSDEDSDEEGDYEDHEQTDESKDMEDAKRCDLLKILLDYGADANVRSKNKNTEDNEYMSSREVGMTPAMLAARRGYLRCLRVLIEDGGADLNAKAPDGKTALIISAEEDQEACLKFLADHVTSSTLNLFLAAWSKDKVTLTLLLENGALVDTNIEEGRTPLALAIDNSDPGVVITLLQHGADPTLYRKHRDFLHSMVICQQDAVVRALVMKGFPPLDLRLSDFFRYSNRCSPFRHEERGTRYVERTAVSPLCVALLYDNPGIARYFIANRFFTRFDIVRLYNDPDLRRILQDAEVRESIEILDFLHAVPQSLFNLSLIAVSHALTQDYQPDENPRQKEKVVPVFKPSFRERVNGLGLPPILQRALLHDTPTSNICCQSWSDLTLGEEERDSVSTVMVRIEQMPSLTKQENSMPKIILRIKMMGTLASNTRRQMI